MYKCWACSSTVCKGEDGKIVCANCGLTYWTEHRENDYNSAYQDSTTLYNKYLLYFPKIHDQNINIFKKINPVESLAVDSLSKIKPDTHVDIGCGVGRFLRAISETGIQSAGVEKSEHLVDLLRNKGYSCAHDMTQVPNLVNVGDNVSVSLFEVIEHVTEPEKFLLEIINFFKPNYLAISVPNSLERRRFDPNFKQQDRPPNHLSRWSQKSLYSLFSNLQDYCVSVKKVPPSRKELVHALLKGNFKSVYVHLYALIWRPRYWYFCELKRK